MYHWQEYHGAGEAILRPLADARGYLPEPGDDYTAFQYHWIVMSPEGPYVPDWLWSDHVQRCEAARREAMAQLEDARNWVVTRKAYWARQRHAASVNRRRKAR